MGLGTVNDRMKSVFVESPNREGGTSAEVVLANEQALNQGSILSGVEYDAITFSYPDEVTEIHRYYTGGVNGELVATVTTVYQTSTKKNLVSLVRT